LKVDRLGDVPSRASQPNMELKYNGLNRLTGSSGTPISGAKYLETKSYFLPLAGLKETDSRGIAAEYPVGKSIYLIKRNSHLLNSSLISLKCIIIIGKWRK
jgi:hypothetical protein